MRLGLVAAAILTISCTGAPKPPQDAINRIDAYMKQGGTVLFDTRDAFEAPSGPGGASQTPGMLTLRNILSSLDVPELEALVVPQVRASRLTLAYEACEPGLAVHADRDKLRQIVLNLLTNAIKYTPAGGAVRVSCEADDEREARIRSVEAAYLDATVPGATLDAVLAAGIAGYAAAGFDAETF